MLLSPNPTPGKATLILVASLFAILGTAIAFERTAAETTALPKLQQPSVLMLRGHDMWGSIPQRLREETPEQHACWGFDEFTDYGACN